MKKNFNTLSVSKQCVHREIGDANVYYGLCFDWINGIVENKSFYKNFSSIFNYVKEALETKYILALAKLFAKPPEECLWKLVFEAKKVSDKEFELKLEREPSFIHEQMRDARKTFLEKSDIYINKIRKIEEQINPLRNMQRAHNFPFRVQGKKVTWQDAKEWLTFAEEVFVNAMDAVCETSGSVGNFFPETLNTDIRYFVSIVKSIKMDDMVKNK